jgi:hypothetical protein
MSVQPVNDFHPFHAFLHEELDNGPMLYFHEKSHFLEWPGNFGRAWQVTALMVQSNSVTVPFSSISTIRPAGPQ